MSMLPGRLGSLRARDVMTPEVITVTDTDTVDAAVHQLREHPNTGAPVIDADGRFVGILSISDLVQPGSAAEDTQRTRRDVDHAAANMAWNLFDQARPVEGDTRTDRVADRMTRDVATVGLNSLLVEVARVMCDGHWHRVPVVKRSGSLCGIISAMDILAAIVNAADERETLEDTVTP